MKAENPYVKLFQLILPLDIALFFDLVDVREETVTDRRELHLYLDEKPVVPTGYKSTDLSPNGFYEGGSIQDFPIRDRDIFSCLSILINDYFLYNFTDNQ
jgi:hypothetical protein